MFWLALVLSLNMLLSFCVSSSKHNIVLLKYTCAEFISIKLLWESQIKKLKKHKYPSLRKSYSTSRKGIGGREKKEKISKSKTTTLTYFLIIWKRNNKIKAVKTCVLHKLLTCTESFMLLTVSNLRTTVFCFENIELLK